MGIKGDKTKQFIRRSRKQVTMDLSPKRTDRVEATAYFTFFLRWYYIVAKELY